LFVVGGVLRLVGASQITLRDDAKRKTNVKRAIGAWRTLELRRGLASPIRRFNMGRRARTQIWGGR